MALYMLLHAEYRVMVATVQVSSTGEIRWSPFKTSAAALLAARDNLKNKFSITTDLNSCILQYDILIISDKRIVSLFNLSKTVSKCLWIEKRWYGVDNKYTSRASLYKTDKL